MSLPRLLIVGLNYAPEPVGIGPYTAGLAEVYAVTGEKAKAIELLDGLLSRPGDLTVPLLKLDPTYDNLRDDPAFQQMLAKHYT